MRLCRGEPFLERFESIIFAIGFRANDADASALI
jgi:hypothetical protein